MGRRPDLERTNTFSLEIGTFIDLYRKKYHGQPMPQSFRNRWLVLKWTRKESDAFEPIGVDCRISRDYHESYDTFDGAETDISQTASHFRTDFHWITLETEFSMT